MWTPTTRRSPESGQTLTIFALVLAVLCGFVALSIDLGLILYNRVDFQKSADAAALAAAQELPDAAGAVAVAEQYLGANGFDITDPDHSYEITTPYQGDPNKIEVKISGDVAFLFGRVLGLDFVNVPARAVGGASVGTSSPASDASIIALSLAQCKSLEVNANAAFTAEGPILINSDCSSFAAEFGCSATCRALGGIESVGGVKKDNKCVQCTVTIISHFDDPLADVLPPCFPNSPTPCEDIGTLVVRNGSASNPQTLGTGTDFEPGIYYGGMDVGPSTAATLAPGIYIMAGGGFKMNSSASLTAEGVFIYNTEDPDNPFGDGAFRAMEINTSASANFSAMTTGPYAGLLFFQDRLNTEKAVFNPSSSFGSGTIYFPAAFIDANPNARMVLQIIADAVKINNNAAFTAEFDGDKFYSAGGESWIKLLE